MASKIYNVFHLIERGYYRVLFNELRARLYSHTLSYGLRRDLETRFEAPPAKIKMHIRELTQTDVTQLLDPVNNPETNPRILANQLSMVEANLPTCYVAVTVNDKPRYMQWLIGSDHNRIIKKFFKGVFPALDKSEALLEGAYSHPGYRGLRIMPMAMALIAEKAEDINARWVITFVNMSNIASLKGCHRSGFEPYLIRDTRWFLFMKKVKFEPITPDQYNNFYESMASKQVPTSGENEILVPESTQTVNDYI